METDSHSLPKRSGAMRNTSVLYTLIILMVIGNASNAFCWDGQRKGFILGFGLGSGLTSYTQSVEYSGFSTTSDRENKLPINTDFRIGYAPDKQFSIFYVNKVSWFGLDNAFGDNVTIANGVGGLGFSYFLLESCPSIYYTGSIGVSSWNTPFEEGSEAWTGFGLSFGWGYEFSPHFTFENVVSWGKPSKKESGFEVSTNAFPLYAMINILGY